MYHLPKDCITLIYEYDNTFREIYTNKVMNQLNNYIGWCEIEKNTFIESIPFNYMELVELPDDEYELYNHRINGTFCTFYFRKFFNIQ